MIIIQPFGIYILRLNLILPPQRTLRTAYTHITYNRRLIRIDKFYPLRFSSGEHGLCEPTFVGILLKLPKNIARNNSIIR